MNTRVFYYTEKKMSIEILKKQLTRGDLCDILITVEQSFNRYAKKE